MSKKVAKIIMVILIAVVILVGIVYLVDLNRMKNNEPVFFSTWGRTYAPLIEKDKEQSVEEIFSFTGTVVDTIGIYEEVAWVEPIPGTIQIIIEPNENEPIRKKADKIVTYLKEYDGNNYEAGTIVKVTYTGSITNVTYSDELKQVECTSIAELQNKTLDMYKKILENLIKQDEALNTNAKFIAIDFENFLAHHKDRYSNDNQYRSLSPNEKQALLDFCRQYNENVIEASFEQLKEQGHFNEETKSLEGILISVNKTETITENKAIIRVAKYRSALGAIMPKYELNLIDDSYWNLKVLDTIIS